MRRIIVASLVWMVLGLNVMADSVTGVGFELDQQKLEAGKLQVFKEDFAENKKRVVGVILIDAPPEEVWRVISDWDGMGAYVPGLEYYKTRYVVRPMGDGGGRSLIEGRLSLLNITYTLDATFDASRLRQEWHLIKAADIGSYARQGLEINAPSGGLENIEGYGFLVPNGAKTIYVYAPVVEVGIKLPAAIELALSRNTLSGYVKAVKRRVEQPDA